MDRHSAEIDLRGMCAGNPAFFISRISQNRVGSSPRINFEPAFVGMSKVSLCFSFNTIGIPEADRGTLRLSSGVECPAVSRLSYGACNGVIAGRFVESGDPGEMSSVEFFSDVSVPFLKAAVELGDGAFFNLDSAVLATRFRPSEARLRARRGGSWEGVHNGSWEFRTVLPRRHGAPGGRIGGGTTSQSARDRVLSASQVGRSEVFGVY